MRLTSQLLIILSALSGAGIPKLVSAASSARLGVSAFVLTRCNIKVLVTSTGQPNTTSACSDDTKPTILISSENMAESKKSSFGEGMTPSGGGIDVTVTY